MPSEHGGAKLGGLRREHLVAATLVTAATIVLGYASGFGVVSAGAVQSPQTGPGNVVAAPPGMPQTGPPAAGPLPAGAVPRGQQVGIRPGSHRVTGTAPGAAPGTAPGAAPGPGFDHAEEPDFGQLPIYRPPAPGPAGPAGGEPLAPPGGPESPAPQCEPGILGSLLALIARILGGTEPPTAMAASGVVLPAPVLSPQGPVDPLKLPVLLPFGDRFVPVYGLVPLLNTVAERHRALVRQEQARTTASPLLPMAGPAPAPAPAAGPVAPAAGHPAEENQLAQLATLLAPLGMELNLTTRSTDPMLIPVLGSLGCGGLLRAEPPGAGR